MTSSPSETETAAVHPLQEYADRVAAAVGGDGTVTFDTVKIRVPLERWVDALTTARDELDLVFFSWLSAVDWSSEVEVGDPFPEPVEDRLELLATVADVSEGRRVIFSTDLDKETPSAPTLIDVYAGANWHEREAHEMFGIHFDGHPNLIHLYLPDQFLGNPLRKSYPLLSREVKPWPGTVDVEAMPGSDEGTEDEGAEGDGAEADGPSEENPEA
ncbi:MAG TPA: NADH-quinone oxidoreductase subunit C [Acidimicrobiia bacterium]|nr:NADH-quinone oxidoreductase subunit C [Acidimicrobiia bacterium]